MHIAVRVCFLSERCDRLYVRQAPMSQKSLKNWPSAPTTQFFCQELGRFVQFCLFLRSERNAFVIVDVDSKLSYHVASTVFAAGKSLPLPDSALFHCSAVPFQCPASATSLLGRI